MLLSVRYDQKMYTGANGSKSAGGSLIVDANFGVRSGAISDVSMAMGMYHSFNTTKNWYKKLITRVDVGVRAAKIFVWSNLTASLAVRA